MEYVSKSKGALSEDRGCRKQRGQLISSGVPASTPQPNGNVGVDHNSRRQKPETGTLLARWGLIMLHPWPQARAMVMLSSQKTTLRRKPALFRGGALWVTCSVCRVPETNLTGL
ncbi:hypothetical protein B0H65DRAFT_545126 [Neurospora tetraspora]|uniref:Uncharacterized protein n=1 Tax=Neurospora tetraspora TaxID=94610 RepID=A0AAE0JQK3_9PEZI|nr:hypothetical protein B0H65DRAFT_545126 [Neurospora tetraspora]